MESKEKIGEGENSREAFGRALSASIPPLIRDCFGPTVEQVGWIVFSSQERKPAEKSAKRKEK